ncbi:MAG: hypothetical protein IT259_10305 [Saprospiraceae bacterium]|nr:hypothetical protein [Saprospiraceae bacterium]
MNLSSLNCPVCDTANQRNADQCISCGSSLGFVNVNLFSDAYFQDGLTQRYQVESAACAAKGLGSVVLQFETMLADNGRALINMSSDLLFKLVNENQAYLPYQTAVEQGKRDKSAFANDRDRCLVESAFYGIDGGKLVYAALSLDEKGLTTYGDVVVLLRTPTIEKRTTVFETNTYFLFDRLVDAGWRVRKTIPAGHAGTWNERAKVAVIKHGIQVEPHFQHDEFAALILKSGVDRTDDEFIELHIMNMVTTANFEKIVFQKKPSSRYNALQAKIFTAKTKAHGIAVEGL